MKTHFRLKCPHCQHEGKIQVGFAGKDVECLNCKELFRAPTHTSVHCPQCQVRLRIPVEYFGREVSCKNCEHVFVAMPVEVTAMGASQYHLVLNDTERKQVLDQLFQRVKQLEDNYTHLAASPVTPQIAELAPAPAPDMARERELASANEELTRQLRETREELERTKALTMQLGIRANETDRLAAQLALSEALAQRLQNETDSLRTGFRNLGPMVVSAFSTEIDAIHEECEKLRLHITDAHELLENRHDNSHRLAGLSRDLINAVRKERGQFDEERQTAREELENLQRQIADLEAKLGERTGQLEESNRLIDEINHQRQTDIDQLRILMQDLDAARQEAASLAHGFPAAETETPLETPAPDVSESPAFLALQDQIQSGTHRITELEAELFDLRQDIAMRDQLIDELQTRTADLEILGRDRDDLEQQLKAALDEQTELTRQLKELEDLRVADREEIQRLATDLEESVVMVTEFHNQLKDLDETYSQWQTATQERDRFQQLALDLEQQLQQTQTQISVIQDELENLRTELVESEQSSEEAIQQQKQLYLDLLQECYGNTGGSVPSSTHS